MNATEYWITIAELQNFKKAAAGVLDADEIEGLIAFLSNHPDAGDIMPRTGGIRKLRWGAKGKGKSGGARIVYFFHDLNMPLYLIACFSKGDRVDISESERNQMRKLTKELVDMNWEKSDYQALTQAASPA